MKRKRICLLAAVLFFLASDNVLTAGEEESMSGENGKPNHLIGESSPYLLQHAYNPVNWYPWTEEALARAKKENRPILLSIGYSTCHWCHVMEDESFSDPAIAALMNRYFISIKVDREERPDLDAIYMTAVQAMTGSGGWPLNVFLTPDLKPFYGGTYFPAEPGRGTISWPDLLTRIGESWGDDAMREKIVASSEHLTENLGRHLTWSASDVKPDEKLIDAAYEALLSRYDEKHGGFSLKPKFPSPVNQAFLFSYHALRAKNQDREKKAEKALDMALSTLRHMAHGGIFDQVGGGFHRYAVDERWHIPHFEKMLYDNAQLITNYLEAYRITKDRFYGNIARETIDYVLKEMRDPEGGFYSAEDADSIPGVLSEYGVLREKREKREGAFYVWEAGEIESIFAEKDSSKNTYPIFAHRFDVKFGGNAESDPHGEFRNQNTLHVVAGFKETAERFGMSVVETRIRIEEGLRLLKDARKERSRPQRDDKIITAWNGLMISALAKASHVLGEPSYLEAAEKAALFIHDNLYVKEGEGLYRRWRKGRKKVMGTAADYALMVSALMDLYEAGFDTRWMDWAVTLCDDMVRLFYDEVNGGFYQTRLTHDKNLILRMKDDTDSVIPSAGSVAVQVLLRLHRITDKKIFFTAADKTLKTTMARIASYPGSAPQMMMAFQAFLEKPFQLIIAGHREAAVTQRMLATWRRHLPQGGTLLLVDSSEARKILGTHLPFLNQVPLASGKPTAYLCIGKSCREPTTSPSTLEKMLKEELR